MGQDVLGALVDGPTQSPAQADPQIDDEVAADGVGKQNNGKALIVEPA